MTLFGASGLFLFIAVVAGGTLIFGLWRQASSLPVPGDDQQSYQILPRTTPMAAMLDPHAPEQIASDDTDPPARSPTPISG